MGIRAQTRPQLLAHRHRRRCARGDPGARSGERLERARLAAPAAAAVEPYGAHDAGGFRNILPRVRRSRQPLPALDFPPAPTRRTGSTSSRSTTTCLRRSLTDAKLPKYYKDATFGVKPDDVESRISPSRGSRSSATRATASPTSTATPTPT